MEAQRRDGLETWWVDRREVLEPWPHTQATPPSLLLLGCHEVSNFATPHAPRPDACFFLTIPRTTEPVSRGLKLLRPWPQINVSSSLFSQVCRHSVTVAKLTDTLILWSTVLSVCHILKHVICHILKCCMYCISHPEALYVLCVTS